MMTLQDMKKVVDQLSPEERRELREYLEQRESIELPASTPEEHARRLDEAFEQLRAGLTQRELDEMTAAMNAETTQPFDEDEWKD